MGAQELEGVLLSDVEGSLWPAELVARCRVAGTVPVAIARVTVSDGTITGVGTVPCGLSLFPEKVTVPEGTVTGGFARTVIGVDPPASANGTCGIVVCALDRDGKAYVLADASVSGMSPEGWARVVAHAAETWAADRIIVEKNQGGDMAAAVLRGADAALPLQMEHAALSKAARAEPVAALFERGEAFFAGTFPELEAELAGLVPGGGYHGPSTGSGRRSPDRADAMVWALWALTQGPKRAMPRIRVL